jgi:geranylgeranyl pyrophosphate synthase/predicted secreted hydrolase
MDCPISPNQSLGLGIDLESLDLPHPSSNTEWWYINSHLNTVTGECFSVFASFFRLIIGYKEENHQPIYAYSVVWAIIDLKNQKYYPLSLVDQCAPAASLKVLDGPSNRMDPFLGKAAREVFQQGKFPLPDQVLKRDPIVNLEKLDLDFDGNQFQKQRDGSYRLRLIQEEHEIECELIFKPLKPPVLHGDQGVVQGNSGEDMFYYFIPRCQVEGTLRLNGQDLHIQEGQGWYDHEFSLFPLENEFNGIQQDIAWNWISIQLDNGYEISGYDLFDNNNGGQRCGHWLIVIDPEGHWHQYPNFTLLPLDTWTSTRTFQDYPIGWQLEAPALQLNLTVKADFPEQELITLISKPAFWEGRITVSGIFQGQQVMGVGFVERSNFQPVERLTDFLKAVGRQTRKSIQSFLPIEPNQQDLQKLVASEENIHYLDGLDFEQYSRALIQPIRSVVDSGGKSWRSYALLACIDIVGGNSQPFLPWLAVPELLHVGSLIVDDVEDQSSIRRGQPACHTVYGEAIAINAGSACSFLVEVLMRGYALSDWEKLKIYESFFEALRAAHAGQAIDIDGFAHLMPEVVQTGNGKLLEQRILAVHRLKSAVPASRLAQIGALLGQGSPEQIKGIGFFFETLGLAFQIIDDVLNLRGFDQVLKSKGEDISAGKITMPIAKAMSRLSCEERESLWQVLSSKPTEPAVISSIIGQLEQCGALEACKQQAWDLIEKSWRQLDPLLPDSDVKIKLRAFSWYVLERHY